jgi:hypothetical protein
MIIKRKDRRDILETYNIIRRLSKINGPDISKSLIDRVMFKSEALLPLGKEYWWFIAFDNRSETPKQLMLLIYRKHGRKMLFNGKEMSFHASDHDEFMVVTSGWFFDGLNMHELGDHNVTATLDHGKLTSSVSHQKLVIAGSFPNYQILLGNLIRLEIGESNTLRGKMGNGVMIPPLAMGWVDAYGAIEGEVMGESFIGEAHLQKVVGISPPLSFFWFRLLFADSSVLTSFSLKTGKDSDTLFHRSLKFFDKSNNETILFKNPRLKFTKTENKPLNWIIEGWDDQRELRVVLESHGKKCYTTKGGGTQVDTEYIVTPTELTLKTPERIITLEDVGRGGGSLEDGHW